MRTTVPRRTRSALAELVEFVRVGVQLVFDELEPLRVPATRSTSGPVLH